MCDVIVHAITPAIKCQGTQGKQDPQLGKHRSTQVHTSVRRALLSAERHKLVQCPRNELQDTQATTKIDVEPVETHFLTRT